MDDGFPNAKKHSRIVYNPTFVILQLFYLLFKSISPAAFLAIIFSARSTLIFQRLLFIATSYFTHFDVKSMIHAIMT